MQELKEIIEKMAKIGNCTYGVALSTAKVLLKDFIKEEEEHRELKKETTELFL